MKFCLPPNLTRKFLQGIKSGEIDVEKLGQMQTSAERRAFLEPYVGKINAKEVNALFESKLLLKNQEQGMINWIKSVGNLKPAIIKDLTAKVKSMDNILSTAETDAFLEDLAAKKLGVKEVTTEEAKNILELSKRFSETETKVNSDFTFDSESDRMDYGRAKVALDNYVNDLKSKSAELTLQEFKEKPVASVKKSIYDFAGLTKSLKASFDNSVLLRQGLKALITNPKIWLKNAKQSFVDMYKTFGGKNVMDEIRADVLSRPNAISGLYRKEKLAVGVTEEAYPTSLPEKIPGLGKAFKASENAFTGFQYRTRADIFDKYVDIAKKSDADITGIGRIVNALTGRGKLPLGGEKIAGEVNNVFFSPRSVMSHIETLTGHTFQKDISPFARKQAAINLLKIIGAVGGILTIAKAINPKSVDFDPRSADFGKIRIGDTRFDVTGGMASLVTLGARIATHSTKSSTTGKVSQLDTGKFGSQTTGGTIWNFFQNKLSPVASTVNDLFIRKTDFQGKPPTALGEISNLTMPLPITNYQELAADPKSANMVAALIADALGVSVNTYAAAKPKKK